MSEGKIYLLIIFFFVIVAFLPENVMLIVMLPIGLFAAFCFFFTIAFFIEYLLMDIFGHKEPIFKGVYDWLEKILKMK